MSLRSETGKRSQNAGFTLLEAMLAFVILGIVLGATYTLSTRSLSQQVDARRDFELASMAGALLDEYILTYPEMARSGTYKRTWEWRISETPERPLEPTNYDHYFNFIRVTAHVTRRGSPAEVREVSTVVARRAKAR